jgi:hypothetical protein
VYNSDRGCRAVAHQPGGKPEQIPLAQNESDSQSPSPETPKREPHEALKAYERPRILSREPLEVMAATCTRPFGKATGVCNTGRS